MKALEAIENEVDPTPEIERLRGLAAQSTGKIAQLKKSLAADPKYANRPDIHAQADKLQGMAGQRDQLMSRLAAVAQYRFELKRLRLTNDQVSGLIPATAMRTSPVAGRWDSRYMRGPGWVIGVRDKEGLEHLFTRPIQIPPQPQQPAQQ